VNPLITGDYAFKPDERPALPGSPFNPSHPSSRRIAYFGIGVLTGITGGLGNALVTANLASIQGALGLGTVEAAWLPAAYVMTNVCANLVLVRLRIQYGLQPFVRWMLVAYAAITLAHLFVQGFWTAVLVRGASGIAAAALTTICVLTMMQAMPAAKRLAGIMLGIGIPQLATPVARIISPPLLISGNWRMTYLVELGLALLTLAALAALPLPPSERADAFEREDTVSVCLLFPGVALLCAVFGLGRIVWWTDAPWIGWSLVGAILLLTAGIVVERRRANPLIQTSFLSTGAILRLAFAAVSIRILVSEQTFGSIGLLGTVGLGPDQFQTLYIVVLLASIAGIAAAVLTFNPDRIGRPILVACAFIAIGAFMDAGSNNLTRPANLYVSQALIGFGALLFIGPALLAGNVRMLLAGPQNFISWVVLFGATQSLGGLIGSSIFGTLETYREKFHSNELIGHIVMTDPVVVQRFAAANHLLRSTVADPSLRNAEAATLISQQASREASVLAFNDVFLAIGVLATIVLLIGIVMELRMRARGERSPVRILLERLAPAVSDASIT
jgi:MFS family permease